MRGGIRRSFDVSKLFQTGFWIYGAPGTGKSTLMSWIQSTFTNSCVELSCSKVNIFERFRLYKKSIIVISDGEFLNIETIRLIKLITGRDTIVYDLKFQNVTDSFRSDAVLFVTSNLELGSATASVHDAGLADRFISIEFPYIPKKPQAGVLDSLIKNTSALINWSLETPKEILQLQVRVNTLNRDSLHNDPFVGFIRSTLILDNDGFTPSSELLLKLDDYFEENGYPAISGFVKRTVPTKIKNFLSLSYMFL